MTKIDIDTYVGNLFFAMWFLFYLFCSFCPLAFFFCLTADRKRPVMHASFLFVRADWAVFGCWCLVLMLILHSPAQAQQQQQQHTTPCTIQLISNFKATFNATSTCLGTSVYALVYKIFLIKIRGFFGWPFNEASAPLNAQRPVAYAHETQTQPENHRHNKSLGHPDRHAHVITITIFR